MNKVKLEFEYNESPTSNNAISLFISVEFNENKMKDILDVHEFFNSIEKPGITPLFTCSCGNFGCGGYYVEVYHESTEFVLKNSYDPLSNLDKPSLINTFEFRISWEDVLLIGQQIIDVIAEIIKKYPDFEIFTGTYDTINLVEKIPLYKNVLKKLNAKL